MLIIINNIQPKIHLRKISIFITSANNYYFKLVHAKYEFNESHKI